MLPPRLRRRAAHCRRERGIEERRAPPFSHEVGGPENGYAMCPLMVSRVPRLDSPTRVDTSQSAAGLRGGQGGRVPRPRRAMIVAVSITGQYEYRGAVSDSPLFPRDIYISLNQHAPPRPPTGASPPRVAVFVTHVSGGILHSQGRGRIKHGSDCPSPPIFVSVRLWGTRTRLAHKRAAHMRGQVTRSASERMANIALRDGE